VKRTISLLLTLLVCASWACLAAPEDDALHLGGLRLEALQNDDGGWDWPLDDGNPASPSPTNTVGPIAMGLAQAYWNGSEAVFAAALVDAGGLLLSKTNNFSPSDGYMATMLDSIFGGSTYRDHVNSNFYGPLAAGTYDKNGSGTLYDTAGYVNLIRTARSGSIANLAAWDIGMGLVGAAACGGDTASWIDGAKAEIDELDSSGYYDVIGLAGAVFGLAYVGEDFDPTAGEHAAASSIGDLGDILAGYQIPGGTGGFTWNANYLAPGNSDETVQETAYAMLALNELDRLGYLDVITDAADWLVDFQAGTGGWTNYNGGSENNEVTGEALWGVHWVYIEDIWVDDSGADNVFGYGSLPLASVQLGVSLVQGHGGTVHIGDGTYNEQIIIGSDLILDGNGAGTIVVAPAVPGQFVLAESSAIWEPVIFAYGGTDDGAGNISGTEISQIDISNLVVDGNDRTPTQRSAGILLRNVSGTISGTVVQNMNVNGKETFGIIVYGDSDVTIDGNTVTDFSRGGIGVMSGTATISNNVVAGPGLGVPVTWAPNGIQIGYGATGTISGNEVSGCGWPGSAWSGTAVMVVDTSNVSVENNYVHDNETGIGITDFPEAAYGSTWAGTVSDIVVEGNTLDNNEWALDICNEAIGITVHYNVFSNSVYDAIDVWSYHYYWPTYGIPFPSDVEIHYNSITGSGGSGLWVMDGIGAPVDATLNWWGDGDGPSGEGTGAGDSVSTNVIFSPWLGIDPDADPGTVGVQLVSPLVFVVDDIGPAPSNGYLDAAIAAANSVLGTDTIEVRHGSYDTDEPITDGVNVVSEVGSATHTLLNASTVIQVPGVLLGRLRQGFTINGSVAVGAGVDASTIHINWNDIYGVLINDGFNTLDGTFNYWGEDGPNTVGDIAIFPILPETSDTIIGYMDAHGLSALDAIDYSLLLDLYLSGREALIGVELQNTFGFSYAEAAELLDTYGAAAVDRALMLSAGDYETFLIQLVGYGVGETAGGGGGAAEAIESYLAGDMVPLSLQLVHPVTGEIVDDALVSYSICRMLENGTPEILAFGVMTFDGDLASYTFELDTAGWEPGVYDVFLGSDDGRSIQYQIEIGG